MADTMPQMPSEDEDFDAVIEPRTRKPRTRRSPAPLQPVVARTLPVSTTQPVAVNIVDETPEPVASNNTPESPQQAAYAPEAPSSDQEPAEEVVVAHKAPEFVEPFNSPVPAKPVVERPAAKASAPVLVAAAAQPEKMVKSPKPPRTTNSSAAKHLVIEAVLVLIIAALGLWAWQLYTDRTALRSQVSTLQANPQATIQKQTDGLISDVSKLLTLPVGETPTIANVSDVSQARQQSAFFNNAQNGDKVLMYVKAGEAILYRPATNKIILVAPLTFNSASATTPTSTTKP
jgi:hypothetical protein